MEKDWIPLEDCVNSILHKGFIQKARDGVFPAYVVFRFTYQKHSDDLKEGENFDTSLPGYHEMSDFNPVGIVEFAAIDIRRGDDDYDFICESVESLAVHLKEVGKNEVSDLPYEVEPLPYNLGEPLLVLESLHSSDLKELKDLGIKVTDISRYHM